MAAVVHQALSMQLCRQRFPGGKPRFADSFLPAPLPRRQAPVRVTQRMMSEDAGDNALLYIESGHLSDHSDHSDHDGDREERLQEAKGKRYVATKEEE